MILFQTTDLIDRIESKNINTVDWFCLKNKQIHKYIDSYAIEIDDKVKILKSRFGNDTGRIYLINDFKQKYQNE
jgi:hypothetical protein